MLKQLLLVLGISLVASQAAAEIKIGIIYSATGPVAAAGLAQQRTIQILPKEFGGEPVTYIALDDGGDTTATVRAAKKLLADEKVDIILGPTSSANALAITDAMAADETPLISLGGSSRIVSPVTGAKKWVFKTPQSDDLMAEVVAEHMIKKGVKTLGIIAFNDVYGEGWTKEITRLVTTAGIKIVSLEKYERNDPSVMGQVLKTLAANPDAVFIAAAGTPGVLPQVALVEKGYKGKFYQTHGVAQPEFIKLGGAAVENTFVPLAPGLVAEDLPNDHPAKGPALEFIKLYEAIPGAGSRSPFASYLWDAAILARVASVEAMKTAKPRTPEFRRALRDAIENIRNLPASNGVYNMSPNDHNGLDQRGRILAQIKKGAWVFAD